MQKIRNDDDHIMFDDDDDDDYNDYSSCEREKVTSGIPFLEISFEMQILKRPSGDEG